MDWPPKNTCFEAFFPLAHWFSLHLQGPATQQYHFRQYLQTVPLPASQQLQRSFQALDTLQSSSLCHLQLPRDTEGGKIPSPGSPAAAALRAPLQPPWLLHTALCAFTAASKDSSCQELLCFSAANALLAPELTLESRGYEPASNILVKILLFFI